MDGKRLLGSFCAGQNEKSYRDTEVNTWDFKRVYRRSELRRHHVVLRDRPKKTLEHRFKLNPTGNVVREDLAWGGGL